FSSRRRHTRSKRDWSSDVCSSDLYPRGTAVLAAVEGTSSYGAGITTALLTEGIEVAEIRALHRRSRARTGKSDPLDAEAAARTRSEERRVGKEGETGGSRYGRRDK